MQTISSLCIGIAPELVNGFLAALISSFVSYIYFKRYEPKDVATLTLLLVIIPTSLSLVIASASRSSAVSCIATYILYYTALLLYVILYRISPFHPLSAYPGPLFAKITKFWLAYVVSQGHAHLYYQRLHEEYGDIVRVGPNELSIRDVSAVHQLMGLNGLPKGPYWDNRSSSPSMIAQRDPRLHAISRHRWGKAFSIPALKDYELIVRKRVVQLVESWESLIHHNASGEKQALIDISAWMTYFTVDVMGDIAFGGGFELMQDGDDLVGICNIIEAGNRAQAIFSHVPWVLPLLRRLPGWGTTIARMRMFAAARVEERRNREEASKDILYHLSIGATDSYSPSSLAADGLLAIIAGSDTTATVLTTLFYYLLASPRSFQKLYEEIDDISLDAELPSEYNKLVRMPWLNACLLETMRLQPPVPSGSQRCVHHGEQPQVVGKYLIPEGTQVYVHTYSLQRDPKNFSDPDSFIPERWISEDGSLGHTETRIHDVRAFIPFGYGPRACIGKQLAMMEARILTVEVLRKFKITQGKLAACDSLGDDWIGTLQDWFVLSKGPLGAIISQV